MGAGKNVGNIGNIENILSLQGGGIIERDTLALLHRNEAVIPLDRVGGGNTYNITIHDATDPRRTAELVAQAIADHDRQRTRAGAYA
jgi:hypothetical protein